MIHRTGLLGEEIDRFFEKFTDLPDDVMANIAETLDSSMAENFVVGGRYGTDNELGGGSTKWEPSKRVLKEGGQTLRGRTGRLLSDIQVRYSDDVILIGSGIIYGGVHHYGRMKTDPGPIPARPWAVVQNEDLEEINDIIVEHFRETMDQ